MLGAHAQTHPSCIQRKRLEGKRRRESQMCWCADSWACASPSSETRAAALSRTRDSACGRCAVDPARRRGSGAANAANAPWVRLFGCYWVQVGLFDASHGARGRLWRPCPLRPSGMDFQATSENHIPSPTRRAPSCRHRWGFQSCTGNPKTALPHSEGIEP